MPLIPKNRLIMRNRTRKEAAKIMAEEEEAKKPKIIPHWKKSYYENLQKMKERWFVIDHQLSNESSSSGFQA